MTPLEATWIDPTILIAAIGTAGIGFGAWLTWLASGASRLQGRIDQLETRISKLETEKQMLADEGVAKTALIMALSSFINRVGLWVLAGGKGVKPVPSAEVRPHIDAELWES